MNPQAYTYFHHPESHVSSVTEKKCKLYKLLQSKFDHTLKMYDSETLLLSKRYWSLQTCSSPGMSFLQQCVYC